MVRPTELKAALRGVRAAARVEQLDRGLSREQRRHLAEVVDHRILEAMQADATSAQIAQELGRGISRAQERMRRARRAGRPDPRLEAPKIVREAPMCARLAPPPWPVSRRCYLESQHLGDHDFGRSGSTGSRQLGINLLRL